MRALRSGGVLLAAAASLLITGFVAAAPPAKKPTATKKPPVADKATEEAKKAVAAAYAKLDAAFTDKNLAPLDEIFVPDFTQAGKDGQTRTLAQLKQLNQASLAAAETVLYRTALLSFTLSKQNPKEATATQRTYLEITLVNPQNQQETRIVARSRSEDSWIQTETGWKCKRIKILNSQQTVNGR